MRHFFVDVLRTALMLVIGAGVTVAVCTLIAKPHSFEANLAPQMSTADSQEDTEFTDSLWAMPSVGRLRDSVVAMKQSARTLLMAVDSDDEVSLQSASLAYRNASREVRVAMGALHAQLGPEYTREIVDEIVGENEQAIDVLEPVRLVTFHDDVL